MVNDDLNMQTFSNQQGVGFGVHGHIGGTGGLPGVGRPATQDAEHGAGDKERRPEPAKPCAHGYGKKRSGLR